MFVKVQNLVQVYQLSFYNIIIVYPDDRHLVLKVYAFRKEQTFIVVLY